MHMRRATQPLLVSLYGPVFNSAQEIPLRPKQSNYSRTHLYPHNFVLAVLYGLNNRITPEHVCILITLYSLSHSDTH
jgi:hypothetical protein